MPERAQRLVVVLYEHPLLGEGIARFIVLSETGVEVVAAPAGDRPAALDALARDPDVVICECGGRERDVARLAPHALIIDVSPAMNTGTVEPHATCMETIMAAVRGVPGRPG